MKETNKRAKFWSACVLVLISLTVQILSIILFVFGAATLYGKSMNILTAIDLIANIFSINLSIWLRCIINLSFGITYIVILIIILKNAISTISYVVRIFNFNIAKSTSFVSVGHAMDKCYGTLSLIVIFQMIACLVGTNVINNLMYIILVLMIAVRLSECFFVEFLNEERLSVFDFIMNLVGNLLASVIVCLMIVALAQPYIGDFITGFKVLINGNINNNGGSTMLVYSLYVNLIMPFLLILLNIFCVSLFKNNVFSSKVNLFDLKIALIKVLSYAAIICCIHIAVLCYFTGNITADIMFSQTIKSDYAPVIILTAIWLVYAVCYNGNIKYIQESA